MIFVLSLVEIGPVVVQKIFLNFVNVFLLFRNYLPLEKSVVLHLNTLPFNQRLLFLVPSLVESVKWFWRRRFPQCIFAISWLFPFWKRTWPFICTYLNPRDLRGLCAKFGWYWSMDSGEEDENGKSLRRQQQQRWRRRWTTDILWSEKLPWASAHMS